MEQEELREKLGAKFHPREVEWRIANSGQKGDRVWAKCFAYIDNRAIMNRLDDVVGPTNWQTGITQLRPASGAEGFLSSIGIRLNAESDWVWKQDGADNTDFEPLKGGISGSTKRAAVSWGIGRYLYDLPEGWAIIHEHGVFKDKLKLSAGPKWTNWSPPILPTWALPAEEFHLENMMTFLKDNYDEKMAKTLVQMFSGKMESLSTVMSRARDRRGDDYYLTLVAYEGVKSLG